MAVESVPLPTDEYPMATESRSVAFAPWPKAEARAPLATAA